MEFQQEEQNEVNFQQYAEILKRRWYVTAGILGAVFGLTAFVTFQQKPVFEAQSKMLLKQGGASALTGLNQRVGELTGLTNFSSPVETEAEVIRSNPLVQKTIDDLNLKDNRGKPLKPLAFLRQLKVKTIKGTDILELAYRDTSPQVAADTVNTLVNNYLESNISVNREEATSARKFLSNQLPKIEQNVVIAEAALRRFKEQNKVVALEEEAKGDVVALGGLLGEITKAKATLSGVATRSAALQNELNLTKDQAVELSTLNESAGVQQVLANYQKAQDELAIAQTRFTKEHPTIKSLAAKEQALRQQLEMRVGKIVDNKQPVNEKDLQIGKIKQELTGELVKSEVERLALDSQVQVLQRAYSDNQAKLRDIPKLEQQQRALERRLQVAQLTYQQVLKQLQEVEVVEKQKVGNARVVSNAVAPERPISPNILLNLLLGGVLGIILGVGMALLLEAMDKSLKRVDQAQRLFGYPLLGKIPQIAVPSGGSAQELPVLNDPYSPATSAFEMLLTNLGFTISDQTLKTIVVTSSIQGEGKSFVAANLALAKAQMGYRVLLIDADMRRPRQHKIWEQPNFTGLSEILVNQSNLQAGAFEASYNLDVLTAGTIPPNPTALLDSQRMVSLIEEVSSNYDFVVVDAPPLTLVTDALLLSKLVNGILFVGRLGVADTGAITAARTQLEQSRQRVLGMVINGVKENIRYGGYYSKGYREENNKKDKDKDKDEKSGYKLPPIRMG
mgnify:FL=1